MEKEDKKEYCKLVRGKIMFGFSIKRFFITLGLSVVMWYMTVIIQGVLGVNAPFGLLGSGNSCNLTGFPIVMCVYSNNSGISVWIINLVNMIFWFWVLHFLWSFFSKRKA